LRVALGDTGHIPEPCRDERLVGLEARGRDPQEVVGPAEHAAQLDDLLEGRHRALERLEGGTVLAGEIDVDEDLEPATRRARVDVRAA